MNTFDLIISDLLRDEHGPSLIEESLRFDASTADKVPLRYRIIALGFVKHFTAEELNQKLRENGCAQLYARSLWEAGLFYAFLKGLSYKEWKKLQETIVRFRDEGGIADPFFQNPTITVRDLRDYLEANSSDDRQAMATRQLTRALEEKIAEAASGEEDFESFLSENIRAFSMVREKTRYYFCKYLYFVLLTKVDRYLDAVRRGISVEEASAELDMFKGITPLKRKKMTFEESRDFLLNCGISCGEIFDAFHYYFFEYVSLDWVQVLADYYGSLDAMPDEEQRRLASALRRQDPVRYGPLTDAAIVAAKQEEMEAAEEALDEAYSLDGDSRGYQRNRAGENTIRKYIRGTLDIDRTTLVCFLLFFGAAANLPAELQITPERLSEILLSCGFPALREQDDFDCFVLGYLDADDRVEYLMQEVTNYALEEENFHLYQVYKHSTSYHEEFEKLTGQG